MKSGIVRGSLGRKGVVIDETLKRSQAEEKNFNISQSIKYAYKIQQSILPTHNELSSLLDHFVVFKPKEVVSGDFYWVLRKRPYTFVAVVDCSGHGVPGAFMSMLGYTHLNYVANQSRSNSPAKILELLDKRIEEAVNSNQDESINDSMDIGLVRINNDTREIVFSGAKRPMILFTNNEYKEIKGGKCSVGHCIMKTKSYKDETFILEHGDSFYLFSDGITDQLGKNDAKYGRQNLINFLNSHKQMSMIEVGSALEMEHYRWLNGHSQTDDITVLGVRL